MKILFGFLALTFLSDCNAQLVVGKVIDREHKIGLYNVSISTLPNRSGTTTDTTGSFKLNMKGIDTLYIHYLGYSDYKVWNFNDFEVTDLGVLELHQIGSSGHITYLKKGKFPFFKKRYDCEYFEAPFDLNPQDLQVKCPDGKIKYQWIILTKYVLGLDMNNIARCYE